MRRILLIGLVATVASSVLAAVREVAAVEVEDARAFVENEETADLH